MGHYDPCGTFDPPYIWGGGASVSNVPYLKVCSFAIWWFDLNCSFLQSLHTMWCAGIHRIGVEFDKTFQRKVYIYSGTQKSKNTYYIRM